MIGDLGSCHPLRLWLVAMLLLLPPMSASADCYAPGRAATAAGRWAEAVAAFDAAARRADCAGSGDILRLPPSTIGKFDSTLVLSLLPLLRRNQSSTNA